MSGTRLWLIRHAPAPVPPGRIPAEDGRPAGIGDGRAAARLARRLPAAPAALVCSPRPRARMTLDALRAAGLDGPPPVEEAALAEQTFGAWAGRAWDDPAVAALAADPAGAEPPGGESFATLCARAGAALEALAAAHAGGDVVVVAHAGTVRAALARALGIAPAAALAFGVAPWSLTRLEAFGPGNWAVHSVNEQGDPW